MSENEDSFSKITITNYFMFEQIFSDPQKAKQLIQRILGSKIGKIKSVSLEQTLKTGIKTKGVRFDVFVEAENGKVYDVEMQTTDKKDLAKRTRFYHDMIDMNTLKSGKSYNELKPSFVIFICTFDPFGLGNYLYSFEMKSNDETPISLNDETYTVFLNINGNHGSISRGLKNVIMYFRDGSARDAFTESLDESVCLVRNDPVKEAEYMTLFFKIEEERQAAREEGREEGREETRKEEEIKQARSIIRLCSLYGADDDEIIKRLNEELHWDHDRASAFLKNFKKK